MRTLLLKTLVVGLAVAMAAPALAQRPRQPGRRGGFGRGVALMMPQVQDELKLSASQKEAIQKVAQEVTGKYRDEMQKARESRDFAKLREIGQKSTAALNKALSSVKKDLKPQQKKRLHQIELQMMGTRAYLQPDVQKALALKPAQKKTIKGTLDGLAKEQQKLLAGGFNREAFAKLREMRQDADKKIDATLTSEQKDKFKELTGKPFEIRRRPGGRRPGATRPDF
jgi:Spy/CpxP family protein refolding chaperone